MRVAGSALQRTRERVQRCSVQATMRPGRLQRGRLDWLEETPRQQRHNKRCGGQPPIPGRRDSTWHAQDPNCRPQQLMGEGREAQQRTGAHRHKGAHAPIHFHAAVARLKLSPCTTSPLADMVCSGPRLPAAKRPPRTHVAPQVRRPDAAASWHCGSHTAGCSWPAGTSLDSTLLQQQLHLLGWRTHLLHADAVVAGPWGLQRAVPTLLFAPHQPWQPAACRLGA